MPCGGAGCAISVRPRSELCAIQVHDLVSEVKRVEDGQGLIDQAEQDRVDPNPLGREIATQRFGQIEQAGPGRRGGHQAGTHIVDVVARDIAFDLLKIRKDRRQESKDGENPQDHDQNRSP